MSSFLIRFFFSLCFCFCSFAFFLQHCRPIYREQWYNDTECLRVVLSWISHMPSTTSTYGTVSDVIIFEFYFIYLPFIFVANRKFTIFSSLNAHLMVVGATWLDFALDFNFVYMERDRGQRLASISMGKQYCEICINIRFHSIFALFPRRFCIYIDSCILFQTLRCQCVCFLCHFHRFNRL